MEATTDLFAQLPKEIILSIYDYLLPEDLSRACSACQKWNLLLSSDVLWRKFVAPKKSGKNANINTSSNDEDNKPFKWIYINRKVNWLHGKVEKFALEGHSKIGGTFYIAHMLSGQNILVTGSRGDIMEEWDLDERKLLKSYEVPTGPASSYRMDDNTLVINRSDIIRWKRHDQSTRQGKDEEFSFRLPYPDSAHDTFNFVHERLLLVSMTQIKLYDMNTGQQMWAIDGTNYRVSRNDIDMDYNRGIIAAGTYLQLLDLNNGQEILRINCPQTTPVPMICKLKDNLLCWATPQKISMVDLRSPEQVVWSTDISLTDTSSYHLKKIYFDEFKCILGTFAGLTFFDAQTGKLLYHKECAGLIDFACNDEYLAVLLGRDTCIFDFTKRDFDAKLTLLFPEDDE